MKEKQSFKCIKLQEGIKLDPMYRLYIDQIPVGKEYWLTVETKQPSRSEAQHRYYWLYLGGISKETGEDKDVLHEYFKDLFLPKKIEVYKNRSVFMYPTTKDLTVVAFMEYIKKIEVETGILSPDTTWNGLDYYIKSGIIK